MAGASCSSATSALPLPTTKDEPWRFTDLRGFDPDAFTCRARSRTGPAQTMLDIAVSGLAQVTESALEIDRAPEGVTFEPLDDHRG